MAELSTLDPYAGLDRRRSPHDAADLVVVVDAACRVRYCSLGAAQAGTLTRIFDSEGTTLRPEIVTIVKRLMLEVDAEPTGRPRLALLDADSVVRLSGLSGDGAKTLFALIFGTNHNRDSLLRAAARYALTRRQCEVLGRILEGDSVAEMAKTLWITENTVQGYVKTLLRKTQARNRPAMIAKVLDWNFADPALLSEISASVAPRRESSPVRA